MRRLTTSGWELTRQSRQVCSSGFVGQLSLSEKSSNTFRSLPYPLGLSARVLDMAMLQYQERGCRVLGGASASLAWECGVCEQVGALLGLIEDKHVPNRQPFPPLSLQKRPQQTRLHDLSQSPTLLERDNVLFSL